MRNHRSLVEVVVIDYHCYAGYGRLPSRLLGKVQISDAKNAASTYGFVHYEVSVALNLDVDDLLVGLIAEIKESLKPDQPDLLDNVEVRFKIVFFVIVNT